MKKILIIVAVLLFNACQLIPDLDRDNPLDEKSDSNVSSEKTVLKVSEVNVASKVDSQPYDDVIQDIYPGDDIYLEVFVKNSGDYDANNLRANITTSSSLASIVPISSGYYLTFEGGANNSILKGRTGYGKITNGSSNSIAPNYNSYAVHLNISSNASSNSVIPFNLNITDEKANSWELEFEIQIL